VDQVVQRRLEIAFGVFVLAVLSVFFAIGLSYPPRPRELPLLVDSVGIVLMLIHLVRVIRAPAKPGKATGAVWNWRPVLLSFGSMVLYLGLTLLIGMVLSSAVIVYGSGMAFGARSRVKMVILSVATVLSIWLLFGVALGLPLYQGVLSDYLF
jgi:hypothetical protein